VAAPGNTKHTAPYGPAAPAVATPPEARPLLAGLLPPGARAAESFGDPEGLRSRPEEDGQLTGAAVARRRREFATARWCAHRALAAAGAPDAGRPLLRGRRGEPLWPAGFTGSITHTDGYRAAAAAPLRLAGTLGIDAEPAAPLHERVLATIALPVERTHLDRLKRTDPQVPWGRLLFSAKEAVYKAWFPLARHPLTFRSVRVTFEPPVAEPPVAGGVSDGATGVFAAVPTGGDWGRGGLPALSGRYLAAAGLLLSVVHSRPSA
jgi:4'-phosphopantetheinyl transferase EntD